LFSSLRPIPRKIVDANNIGSADTGEQPKTAIHERVNGFLRRAE